MLRDDKKRNFEDEERSKRESRYRLLSELEKYEIFNTEEAEKYDTQQALDFIIDEDGNLEFIVAAVAGGKMGFFSSREYVEIPWSYISKIGTDVIVVSADKDKIKRAKA